MSQNPFVILGVDEKTVNQSELDTAYRKLRKKYADNMFSEGEAGAKAARKVSELDQAYTDACEVLQNRTTVVSTGTIYGDIEALIRNGQYEDAQGKLDAVSVRDAEWNYLQAMVFYYKGWFFESRKQLELAIKIEPDNPKYRDALTKLNLKINGDNSGSQQRSYGSTQPAGSDNTAMNCCTQLCAADCLCRCLTGQGLCC